jgi:hypothetical protein
MEGISPRAAQDDVTSVLRPGPADLIEAVTAHLPATPADADGHEHPGQEPFSWRDGLARFQAAHTARQATGSAPSANGTERAVMTGFTPEAAQAGTPAAVVEAARLLRALELVLVRDLCTVWTDDAAGQLWRDLIRYAPPGWTAPVATLLGLHATLTDDPALGRLALRHALAERPGYSLAQLLLDVYALGMDTGQLRAVLSDGAAGATALAEALDGAETTGHQPGAGTRPGTHEE